MLLHFTTFTSLPTALFFFPLPYILTASLCVVGGARNGGSIVSWLCFREDNFVLTLLPVVSVKSFSFQSQAHPHCLLKCLGLSVSETFLRNWGGNSASFSWLCPSSYLVSILLVPLDYLNTCYYLPIFIDFVDISQSWISLSRSLCSHRLDLFIPSDWLLEGVLLSSHLYLMSAGTPRR